MLTASGQRRWRVREKMEGDRKFQRVIAIGFKIRLRKTKERKNKGNF